MDNWHSLWQQAKMHQREALRQAEHDRRAREVLNSGGRRASAARLMLASVVVLLGMVAWWVS